MEWGSSVKWQKKVKSLSHVWFFATHGLYVAHQAPPSMGFPKQEYWSGLPFPSPGIFLGSSRPRDRTQVSHIAGRCFNLWTLLSHSMAGQMYRQTWLVSLPLSIKLKSRCQQGYALCKNLLPCLFLLLAEFNYLVF